MMALYCWITAVISKWSCLTCRQWLNVWWNAMSDSIPQKGFLHLFISTIWKYSISGSFASKPVVVVKMRGHFQDSDTGCFEKEELEARPPNDRRSNSEVWQNWIYKSLARQNHFWIVWNTKPEQNLINRMTKRNSATSWNVINNKLKARHSID